MIHRATETLVRSIFAASSTKHPDAEKPSGASLNDQPEECGDGSP